MRAHVFVLIAVTGCVRAPEAAVCPALHEGDLVLGESLNLASARHDHSEERLVSTQWHEQRSADPGELDCA